MCQLLGVLIVETVSEFATKSAWLAFDQKKPYSETAILGASVIHPHLKQQSTLSLARYTKKKWVFLGETRNMLSSVLRIKNWLSLVKLKSDFCEWPPRSWLVSFGDFGPLPTLM